MARKPNHDGRVLAAALRLHNNGTREFHGYPLARAMSISDKPMNYTTLYRCLARLEKQGMFESRWMPSEDNGPPRRMYRLTASGAAHAAIATDTPTDGLEPGLA